MSSFCVKPDSAVYLQRLFVFVSSGHSDPIAAELKTHKL